MNGNNSFWNQAARSGLVLGGVSSLYLALTHLIGLINLSGLTAILIFILNAILWIAKFAGCIYLMMLFISRYRQSQPEDSSKSRPSAFSYGALVSFLSALIYSAVQLAYTTYIVPDYYETISEVYKMAIDQTALEQIISKMPIIMFFSNLIYCTLFGIIVTAFANKRSASSNPFKN